MTIVTTAMTNGRKRLEVVSERIGFITAGFVGFGGFVDGS
jgi:hypothetical protein